LKGKADATASVPACFAVAASVMGETPPAGPLTVDLAVDSLSFASGVNGPRPVLGREGGKLGTRLPYMQC